MRFVGAQTVNAGGIVELGACKAMAAAAGVGSSISVKIAAAARQGYMNAAAPGMAAFYRASVVDTGNS